MRIHRGALAALFALAGSGLQAAEMPYQVKYRQAILEDGSLRHETRRQNFGFRVEVVNDDEGVKAESRKDGRPFVTAHKGERYSVRIYNPLPVRVAVNLTVDGLNSITGKPSGISDGSKWIIDPYSTVTIPGWQVTGGEARRFFFTDKPKSYAEWRGQMLGRDLGANCGVIGAAFFWNQADLDRYYEDHPIVRYTQRYAPSNLTRDKANAQSLGAAAPSAERARDYDLNEMKKAEEPEEVAGTGMGERQSHPTVQVAFDFNRGMYKLDQALVIYYGFEKQPQPNPFPDVSYAPEMN